MSAFYAVFWLPRLGKCARMDHNAKTNDRVGWTIQPGVRVLSKEKNYYIVEGDALPEIFHKVVEARRLLDTGEADTVNRAVQMTGISRSAFYKYKDAVQPFQDMLHGRIVTFQVVMKDAPGILSTVLNLFAHSGSNILTINQGIPLNGRAAVSISVETSSMAMTIKELLENLDAIEGVLRSEILAG